MIVRFGRSRSSKVIDFDTNRKCVRDFLLVCHSNLRHILHHFRDIAGFFLCRDPTLYFAVARITYIVLVETLNPAHSLTHTSP